MWGYIMTNATKNAQSYIDALRAGDYFTAKNLALYVHKKYGSIAGKPLGEEDILPLVIYELCQTDINKHDAERLNFIVEYLYARGLGNGAVGYSYGTLMAAFPLAVEIKQHDSLSLISMVSIAKSSIMSNLLKRSLTF